MRRVFKVHPGIGIARVGGSESFFIQGEKPGDPPFTISAAGDGAFEGYKDENFVMRRQGVRFRVFEYAVDDTTTNETLVGEVTPDKATIVWNITLANSKCVGPWMDVDGNGGLGGSRAIVPDWGRRRNTVPQGTPPDALIASVSYKVEGSGVRPARQTGRIGDKDVFIGEVLTEATGRLIILGGFGTAGTFDGGVHSLDDFVNNPGWHDDVADGPVDAVLRFPDGALIPVDHGAWVIVAPPDFAPDTAPLCSLQDIVQDALFRDGRVKLPTTISYADDIRPLLLRMARLNDVNQMGVWQQVADLLVDETRISDPSTGSQADREDALLLVLKAEKPGGLIDFRYTSYIKAVLDSWRSGDFIAGSDPKRASPEEPQQFDRSSLERCAGGGFFPGIEAGLILTLPSLIIDEGRMTRGPFQDHDGNTRTLAPGSLTQRMALPWHADFVECQSRWWPSQRPDIARYTPVGQPYPGTPAPGQFGYYWHRGVAVDSIEDQAGDTEQPVSRLNMVQRFAALGVITSVIINGKNVPVENGRDPALDVIV